MKLLSIIILTSLSFSGEMCFDKFEIIEATSQKWYGGQRDTGYGTKYEISIVPNSNSESLKFDEIWIGEKYFEVSSFQKGRRIKNNTFSKGDTITININDRTVPGLSDIDENEKELSSEHVLPFKYKGKALLSYLYKGKRKYKEIETFLVLKELLYP